MQILAPLTEEVLVATLVLPQTMADLQVVATLSQAAHQVQTQIVGVQLLHQLPESNQIDHLVRLLQKTIHRHLLLTEPHLDELQPTQKQVHLVPHPDPHQQIIVTPHLLIVDLVIALTRIEPILAVLRSPLQVDQVADLPEEVPEDNNTL